MAKKNALGRGLDTIFSDNTPEEASGGISSLRISDVEPKADQPRRDFDTETLASLAESIAENGVLQPILVREGTNGMYQIIAGERRWRASKMAGKTEIPAIITDADDLKTAQIALIENLQREDLNPVEEASAYRSLMDNFDLTQEEVSQKVGKSRSAVANSMRLLELPEAALKYLRDGILSAGHCRALLGLHDKSMTESLAEKAVQKNLTVRDMEKAVREANKIKNQPKEEEDVQDIPRVDYVSELEKKVTGLCGRYCKINAKGKRKTVTVEYSDESDLETLLRTLCGEKITEE